MKGKAGLCMTLCMTITVFLFTACGGSGGDSPDGPPDTTAPSNPTGLTAVAASSSSVSLNWNASTDNVGVTGYKIQRGGAQIATVVSNSYFDSGLASSATYTYTVTAYDAAGNVSAPSSAKSATTLAAGQSDTQAPSAPSNLTATAASSSQINLSWTASTDNVGISGYEVWRGSTKIATVTTTAYSNTGLAASTAYTYTVKAFDAANNVSAASQAASATTQSSGGVNTAALKVKVYDWSGQHLANATVVLGNSSGAMVSYGTTDANGERIFSNPPANATITTANSCYSSSTGTRYSLETQYDVNISTIVMSLDNCNQDAGSLGTVTVNMTNIPVEASWVDVHVSGGWAANAAVSNGSATATFPVYSNDFQTDGKISFRAIAGNRVSYGMLLDQTFVSGMTVTIPVNQTFSSLQFQLTSIPSTAKSTGGDVMTSRKTSGFSGSSSSILLSGATATIISVPYIPSYADMYGYWAFLSLDQNNNGMEESHLSIDRLGYTTPTNQTFDFSQQPVLPTNLMVANGATATPTLSWSGGDGNADILYGHVNVTIVAGNIYVYLSGSPSRTSIVFPELPDTLSALRPTSVNSFTVYMQDGDMYAGYDDLMSKMEQYNNGGTWTSPATWMWKSSGTSYSTSTTQALAPPARRAPHSLHRDSKMRLTR